MFCSNLFPWLSGIHRHRKVRAFTEYNTSMYSQSVLVLRGNERAKSDDYMPFITCIMQTTDKKWYFYYILCNELRQLITFLKRLPAYYEDFTTLCGYFAMSVFFCFLATLMIELDRLQ